MKIGMVVHRERSIAGSLAGRVARWAAAHGHQLFVDAADAAAVGQLDQAAGKALRSVLVPTTNPVGVGDVDVMVGIGGDGTILRAVSLVGDRAVPVLGVHAGQLGYLTEVTEDQLVTALDQLVAGTCRTESRMRIAAETFRDTAGSEPQKDSGQPHTDRPPSARGGSALEPTVMVLNEVVVEKAEPGHTIRLNLYLDDSFFTSYLTDGLIVATPTGSTAYALSARGPIIQPTHQALLLTPVAPHQLFDRSLVLSGDAKVTIELGGHRAAHVVADGMLHATLAPGDWLDCVRAAHPAELVKVGPDRFHHVLKRKFNLTDR